MATPAAAQCGGESPSPLAIIETPAPLLPTLTLDLSSPRKGNAAGFDVRLNDVIVEGDGITGFRVFINDPDAEAATSIEDPSYVTSFSFFPDPEPGVPAGTFVVDMDNAISRLLQNGDELDAELTLTLVPIGASSSRIGLQAGFDILE
ncbi:MAG: hypothetical protein ABJ370_00735 [Paracoccaceae bacterium]